MPAPQNARLCLTTYRKGMLARLGHDLRLSLGTFQIELEAGRVRGRFDLRTLRVVGALERGRVVASVPGATDKAEIERVIAAQILQTSAHPYAELDGVLSQAQGAGIELCGSLQLMGRTAPFEAEGRSKDGGLHAGVELVPSRWGIAPYKAFAGALRLEDRVLVELDLDLTTECSELANWQQVTARWSSGELA